MPHEQFRIVEKIKHFVSNSLQSKRQLVDQEEGSAERHREQNNTQERKDDARVRHAHKELRNEKVIENHANSRLFNVLGLSVLINIIFLIIIGILWYLL